MAGRRDSGHARGMPVHFEGFPRVLDRSALKPGRWFMAAVQRAPVLGFSTEVEIDGRAVALTFRFGKAGHVEFAPCYVDEIEGTLTTVEDELVFTPGEPTDRLQPVAPQRRMFPSGALLRLKNGDLGMGFVTRISKGAIVISLSTGEQAEGFDLVFDRWSLTLRRGQAQAALGHYRAASAA